MLLGKRPRPPMIRRTASMTGITLDLGPPQEPISDDGLLHIAGAAAPEQHVPVSPHHDHRDFVTVTTMNRSYDYDNNYLATAAMVPPRRNPYGMAEHMETAHFLRICGLCQRRLVPGRDIYMYRGETAFCSLECREQQMKKDERKEKRTSTLTSVSKRS